MKKTYYIDRKKLLVCQQIFEGYRTLMIYGQVIKYIFFKVVLDDNESRYRGYKHFFPLIPTTNHTNFNNENFFCIEIVQQITYSIQK